MQASIYVSPFVQTLMLRLMVEEGGTPSVRWSTGQKHPIQYQPSSDSFVELTDELMKQTAVYCDEIRLQDDETEVEMTFRTQNANGGFTLAELLDSILAFETVNRPATDWLGGIDNHHVAFEGLTQLRGASSSSDVPDVPTFSINWGS